MIKDIIYFAKVKPDAIIPSKRDEDGCYDLYACFDENEIVIKPGEVKMIPTGIASAFHQTYRLNCKRERGSTGKYGMSVVSGQIDSGYRGEIFVPINNTSSKTIIIDKKTDKPEVYSAYVHYPYTKAICQAALEIVPKVIVKEISYDSLQDIPSQRGAGCFGSSGK